MHRREELFAFMNEMSSNPAQASSMDWKSANQDHLYAELDRIRLLLQRRVLWLRKIWGNDPIQNYAGLVVSDVHADALLAQRDPDAEEKFYADDPDAVLLGRRIQEQEQISRQHAERAARDRGLPTLEILSRLFRLSSLEKDVLLLAAAPDFDPAFERIFAYAQDDATRRYATPHLALTLLGGRQGRGEAAESLWNSFTPEAPLRRFRLLTPAMRVASKSTDELHVEPRIRDYLLGINRVDEQVAIILRNLEAPPFVPRSAEDLKTGVDRLLRQWNGGGKIPAINLIGAAGSGQRWLARAVCADLELTLHSIDLLLLQEEHRDRRELSRLLDREALLLPTAYYLDVSELNSADRSSREMVLDLVNEVNALVIVASREPWQMERRSVAIPVPKTSLEDQVQYWGSALREDMQDIVDHREFLTTLCEQFDFGPEQISQAVQLARGCAAMRGSAESALRAEDLWSASRNQAAQSLESLAQRIVPAFTFDDIVLPQDTMRQLREIAAQVRHRVLVYEKWGFGAKLNRGRGIAALFSGPSGTGKTMAAEVLANDLNLDLYRIDLSGVVSKYIGETEKNLRRVFDSAEQSGAILFFDEADALFGKRSEVKDSHDRYANIEINYLLQRMEDYRGLAILATNMKSLLDSAFLRRLRFLIDFPFPSAVDRQRMWQHVFPADAATEEIDHAFLSRLEIAGGNIRNIALNAAFLAATEKSPIAMSHVLRAARREYTKIDKLVLESEFGPYFSAVRR
jgi:AAA+ superfamily predicted ATPase